MVIGTVSLPEELATRSLSWFKKYYDLTLKGKVEETPEELYKLLGGKLPAKTKKSDDA
jgi:hypothetical protein